MPKPQWMRARKCGFGWDLELDEGQTGGLLFLGDYPLSTCKYLASALGLTVKGDLKKSIKKGVVEYVRGN